MCRLFPALAGLLDDLFGGVRGHGFVVVELHREGAPALGDRAQVAHVALHFGEGGVRFHEREAVTLWVHAEHAAPPAVQVGHDVAGVVVGHRYVNAHDGFEQHRATGLHALFERLGPGYLEGHFGAVHRVEAAVVEHRPDVHYRVTGEHAFGKGLADTLLDGRDVVLGHDAAHDSVGELELGV